MSDVTLAERYTPAIPAAVRRAAAHAETLVRQVNGEETNTTVVAEPPAPAEPAPPAAPTVVEPVQQELPLPEPPAPPAPATDEAA